MYIEEIKLKKGKKEYKLKQYDGKYMAGIKVKKRKKEYRLKNAIEHI